MPHFVLSATNPPRLLKPEGYKYLGVDFESINPPAYAFWLKYFTAYIHSVVRCIDEGAVKNNINQFD